MFSIPLPLATITAPIINTTAATCTAGGSASITNYNANAVYTFNPAGPGISSDGTILDLIAGTSYTITASIGGCTMVTQPTTFSVPPPLGILATPTINSSTAGCSTAGAAIITNYNADAVYTFNPAGPTPSQNGIILGMNEGANYTVTATSGGCTTAPSGIFKISASLLATISTPAINISPATCTSDGAASIENFTAANGYAFDPEGPTLSPSGDGTILGMTAGTRYIVTANNGGCTTAPSEAFSIQPKIITPAAPTINITPATCTSDGTAAITNYNTSVAYTFNIKGPVVEAGGVISGAMPGNFYTITAANENCISAVPTSFVTQPMNLSPVLAIAKSNNIDCVIGNSKLTASGGYTYSWSPAASLNNSHISNPVASPASTTTYHIIATNEAGCKKEDSIEVEVMVGKVENGYQVASAFSPNNDGNNDCFGVSHWGAVTNLKFTIYNRWGEIVFQTNDVSQCWDGKYKGKEQGTTGFPYIIYANTKCGSVFRKGIVILIK